MYREIAAVWPPCEPGFYCSSHHCEAPYGSALSPHLTSHWRTQWQIPVLRPAARSTRSRLWFAAFAHRWPGRGHKAADSQLTPTHSSTSLHSISSSSLNCPHQTTQTSEIQRIPTSSEFDRLKNSNTFRSRWMFVTESFQWRFATFSGPVGRSQVKKRWPDGCVGG